MRKLKNWTVTAEGVKNGGDGLIRYSNYLMSQSEHKGQKIELLFQGDVKNKLREIMLTGEMKNIENKLKKGGRPLNYAWSVAFSYPFAVQKEQLHKSIYRTLLDFYTYINEQNKLNLTHDDIKMIVGNQAIGIIHSEGGVNNHAHLILPKIFKKPSGELITINLTEKKYLKKIKALNNLYTHKYFGQSVIDYKLQVQSEKVAKKRVKKTEYKMFKSVESEIAKMAKAQEQRTEASKAEIEANKAEIQAYQDEAREMISNELKELINTLKTTYTAYKASGEDLQAEAVKKQMDRIEAQLKNGNTLRAEKTAQKAVTAFKQP